MKRLIFLLFLISIAAIAQVVVGGNATIGGNSSAGSGVAAGITVTDLGTCHGTGGSNSGHTCDFGNVTLSTGDVIVMQSSTQGLSFSVGGTWNGVTCTQVGSGVGAGSGAGSNEGHAFHCDNVTGATGDAILTKTQSADDALVFWGMAVKITGLTSHVIDQSVSAAGTGTSWSSGATSTTTAANEAWIGMLGGGQDLTGTFGTWQNSFVRLNDGGQPSGQCCVVDYASRVVSSTGTCTANTTGATSSNWSGFCLTFK